LGGIIKTTGDHSVFVRQRNFVAPKKVKNLKPGEILVNLPFKVRSTFIPGIGTTHKIKSHQFEEVNTEKELLVWNDDFQLEKKQHDYEFALANQGIISQYEIADKIGISQSSVGLWQRGINKPRYFGIASKNIEKGIPQKIKITVGLMKILGYYTAEGRTTDYYSQFVFGAHEKNLHKDCTELMKNTFGIKPHLEYTEDNSLRITYHSKFIANFFEKYCGNGSHNKHIPEFLWDFLEHHKVY